MAAILSSSPRGLSSPLELPDTFSLQLARNLVLDYAKNELTPSKILLAFLDHLPLDGLCNVCEDIIQAQDDPNGLRELAEHYVSNILVPSMFSLRTPLPLLTT